KINTSLLKELIEEFKPFDVLTTYFSRIQYNTHSVVSSSIEVLKFEFANYI
ncbi:3001_t:CDS:1, partial [Gigaspora margarita]